MGTFRTYNAHNVVDLCTLHNMYTGIRRHVQKVRHGTIYNGE